MSRKKEGLERFARATELSQKADREWQESLKLANWEDFKEGYREERFESKRRYLQPRPSKASHEYTEKEIEDISKGKKEAPTYGYEKGRLVGIAHNLMEKGTSIGSLHFALTGALLYERLGHGRRKSVVNKLLTAYEKNVEGRPQRRLSQEDVERTEVFLKM